MRNLILAAILLGSPALVDAQESSPVPDAAALSEAKKLVAEVYRSEYAAAQTKVQKSALAQKIFQVALDTKNDLTARFALLDVAKDIAAGAGDANTAFQVIEKMDENFAIDGIREKGAALNNIVSVLRASEDHKSLAPKILGLIDEAVAVDRFDLAEGYAKLAQQSARKSRDRELIKQAVRRASEVAAAEKKFAVVQQALAVLAKDPTDPEANLTVGKYRCFVKKEWEAGLPMLALGSDESLKQVALMELNEQDALAIGDAWWSLGEKDEKHAAAMQSRAAHWYRKILPSLTGLAKVKVEKRVQDIQSTASAPEQVNAIDEKLTIILLAKQWTRTSLTGNTGVIYTFDEDGRCFGKGADGTPSSITAWNMDEGVLVLIAPSTGAELHGYFDAHNKVFLLKHKGVPHSMLR